MRRRFIVAIEGLTKDQEKQFVEFIQASRLGWWHWIPNFWLITGTNTSVGSEGIRDQLNEIAPGANSLVLEINEDIDWYGFGPQTKDRNYFRWLEKVWGRKD